MPTIKLDDGTKIRVPDGTTRVQMDEIVEDYHARQAVPEGVTAPEVFPSGVGGGSAASLLGALNVAGGSDGSVDAGSPTGASPAAEESPGMLDYLGALPGIAQALDIKDVITQGVEPSDQFPYFALPESIGERRDLGNDITDAGSLVVGGPAAGAGAKAAGRVAKEFVPDVAGGLLGGSIGGSFLPGLGTLAGAKVGARHGANLLGRGKGIRSRTSQAILGKSRGSAPIANRELSPAKHAEAVQRLLLENVR